MKSIVNTCKVFWIRRQFGFETIKCFINSCVVSLIQGVSYEALWQFPAMCLWCCHIYIYIYIYIGSCYLILHELYNLCSYRKSNRNGNNNIRKLNSHIIFIIY